MKFEIARRLAIKKTKVKIKLNNGSEVKGGIELAGDDQFTISEDQTSRKIEDAYGDVSEVSGRGGLGTGTKIAIIADIAVAVVAVVGIIAVKSIDPFENGVLRELNAVRPWHTSHNPERFHRGRLVLARCFLVAGFFFPFTAL